MLPSQKKKSHVPKKSWEKQWKNEHIQTADRTTVTSNTTLSKYIYCRFFLVFLLFKKKWWKPENQSDVTLYMQLCLSLIWLTWRVCQDIIQKCSAWPNRSCGLLRHDGRCQCEFKNFLAHVLGTDRFRDPFFLTSSFETVVTWSCFMQLNWKWLQTILKGSKFQTIANCQCHLFASRCNFCVSSQWLTPPSATKLSEIWHFIYCP